MTAPGARSPRDVPGDPIPSLEERYAALLAVVTEVADELEQMGLHELAFRLHGAVHGA